MRYDKTAFDGLDRAVWLKALQAEGLPLFAGYDTPHYRHKFMLNKNFYSFDGWRKSNPDLDYGKIHLPCAEKAAYEQSCWLPQNVMLGSDRDIDDVADAFRKVYENRGELK